MLDRTGSVDSNTKATFKNQELNEQLCTTDCHENVKNNLLFAGHPN